MAAARTAIERHLASVLTFFPPVEYAFAYGSGVHVQPGLYGNAASSTAGSTASGDRPMIDHIFAVNDPYDWHKKNMQHNPRHYAWTRILGCSAIGGISDYAGVGVHFNTLVDFGEQTIKYGVIGIKPLLADLTAWQDLYIAGRMQKPIVELQASAAVAAAQQINLDAATATALLLLPHTFSSQDLLRTIVGLSYKGDVRVGIAEDPRKIARIVEGSEAGLREMYIPRLQALGSAPVLASRKWTPFPVKQHSPSSGDTGSSGSSSGTATAIGSTSHSSTPGATTSSSTTGSTAGSSNRSSNSSNSSAADSSDSKSSASSSIRDSKSSSNNNISNASLSILQAIGPDTWQRDTSPQQQFWLLQQLPLNVLHTISLKHGFSGPQEHLVPGSFLQKEVITALQQRAQLDTEISDAVAAIVRRSSRRQAVSGFLASGGGRAVQYLYRKVAKTRGKKD